jgi:hypothetical protein
LKANAIRQVHPVVGPGWHGSPKARGLAAVEQATQEYKRVSNETKVSSRKGSCSSSHIVFCCFA